MSIDRKRRTQTATLHNPLNDFEEETIEIELREDPLTERQTRIVRDVFVMPDETPDLEPVIDTDRCFFCPDMVEASTPTYADVDLERGRVGDAISFPNLAPYGAHSNVVVLTDEHYGSPAEFTVENLEDGFTAALEYIDAVEASDPDAEFASVNMNFLPAAGATMVHPHLQTIVDDCGTTRHRRLVEAGRAYYDANGASYWNDLLEVERGGPRHVATTGDVEWLTPFAPIHQRHVRGVLPEHPDIDDDLIGELATGVASVLENYAETGHNTFNFAWLLKPAESAVRPIIDVVVRPVLDEYYSNDAAFFTMLHDEAMVDVAPEEYADSLREHF